MVTIGRSVWFALLLTPIAWAGARFDLRPDLAEPPSGYAANTVVKYDVFLVDTGNPQGAISFRGVFLDFIASSPTLTLDPTFNWVNPGSQGAVFPDLPYTSWVFPLPLPDPSLQITLPDNGEVRIGDIHVNVGLPGTKTFTLMNADEPDPNFGARTEFGFGFPGDPQVVWRAHTGELTGGEVQIHVAVPEPVTMALIVPAVAGALLSRRSIRR